MSQFEELRVFLASPGDVLQERETVKKVIDELNQSLAHESGFRMKVVSWETDAVPGYGKDPQAIINDQVAEMTEYVLFLGIMWNRVGTPTPRGGSGTLEEFERAVAAREKSGQPEIWFYFRNAPAVLDTDEKLNQRREVLKFIDKIKPNGLFGDFTDAVDLEVKFRIQLLKWMAVHLKKRVSNSLPAPKADSPPAKKVRRASKAQAAVLEMLPLEHVRGGTCQSGLRDDEIEYIVDFMFRNNFEWSREAIVANMEPYRRATKGGERLNGFWMSRYLVTNAAFKSFVKATRYLTLPEKRHEEKNWRTRYSDATRDNHPVTHIAIADALAFCQWLGDDVRLPTEVEFEYAARGPNDWLFPWGKAFEKDRCNDLFFNKNDTTSSDLFEQGKSCDGIYDLCGNVNEWVEFDVLSTRPRLPDRHYLMKACFRQSAVFRNVSTRMAAWDAKCFDDVGFRFVANRPIS